MPRTLKEEQITTRNARRGLPKGIHWRRIDADVHLGYRRGAKSGQWLVRWYLGDGSYKHVPLGVADDVLPEGTLSYDDACKRARAHVVEVRARAARDASLPPETVRGAVTAYIAMRDARVRQAYPNSRRRSDGASRLTRYVLNDSLADVNLPELTEDMLVKWKRRLAPHCTPGSRVRTMNDLKAALNLAHRSLRKRLPPDFAETIKWGLACDRTIPAVPVRARENQILPDETVREIVASAAAYDEDGDVGRMILMLAATGARFSQVQRITVGDVQLDRSRIFVPASRKGQGKSDTHYPVQVGSDVLDALRPVVTRAQVRRAAAVALAYEADKTAEMGPRLSWRMDLGRRDDPSMARDLLLARARRNRSVCAATFFNRPCNPFWSPNPAGRRHARHQRFDD